MGTRDEIDFHIDRQTRKHEASGLSRDDARRRALQEFGGLTRWREEVGEARATAAIDAVGRDLQHTLRSLRRDPAFTTMVIATLGLAIGANAAMFGIVDRVMLRGPEHLVAPERLARLYVTRMVRDSREVTSAWQPYVLYVNARDGAPALAAAAAYLPSQIRVGSGIESREVPVTYATANFFALTGVHAALGRFFTDVEDRQPVGQSVIVLGYQFWQREFSGNPAILGDFVTLGDTRFRVVGIAPRGFTGVERTPVAAWIPMSTRPLGPRSPADWAVNWRPNVPVIIVGRVTASPEVAGAQLTALLRRAYSGGDAAMRKASVSLRPISYDIQGAAPAELGLIRLLTAVAVVMLLVAVANTTNLVLARALRRHRELSVRAALGAGRWRLVRLMILESVTIAALAGILGLALAHWGGAAIRSALVPNMAWTELPVDARVLVWTSVATLAAGVLVGLLPALHVSRGDLGLALRGGRLGAANTAATYGIRAALQVGQLAFSLVLLFAAGLFVRSLWDIKHLQLGYDRDRVLALGVSFARTDSGTPDAVARAQLSEQEAYQDLRVRLARVPGVSSVSVAHGSPLSTVDVMRIQVPVSDSLAFVASNPLVTAADAQYFETVGTRVLRGRAFTAEDRGGSDPVVIVNETMANQLWPGADAIGRCIVFGATGSPCARVVGVAQNVHQMSLKEQPLPQCYIPWGLNGGFIDRSRLLVRASGDAHALIPALNDVLRRSAPAIRSAEIKTLEETLDPQVRPWRVGAILFGLFGASVMVVAAIGLFSLVSYLVLQRTHEIGVRIALGAQASHVMRLVVIGSVRMALAGAALGAVMSLALGPVIQPLLFDNSANDLPLLAALGACLLGVAVVASAWPSLRAARVDPVLSLRVD
jgi:putative ABC transport system permease protein